MSVSALRLPAAAYDIIIDDGLHTLEGQQETLANFWPLLKNGGIYVIEDMTYHPMDAWGTHPFVNAPERLTPTVRNIILNNNPFFVMSNVGNPKQKKSVWWPTGSPAPPGGTVGNCLQPQKASHAKHGMREYCTHTYSRKRFSLWEQPNYDSRLFVIVKQQL